MAALWQVRTTNGETLKQMTDLLLRSLFATLVLSWGAAAAQAPAARIESVYTDLSAARCKTVETSEEAASSVQKCPGVAGYGLLVEDNDLRQSVTVVAPDGKRHPLNYWQVVTTAFSSVGDKAEWRVAREGRRLRPIALIVRVNASENPESPEQKTSYLAVAKITAGGVCVTDKVKGGPSANEEARRAADASADKPCLEWKAPA
ncbi:MAG TPA: hypothetical protein VF736_18390 [Pyrinomonadaceae bacterium]|jgi:hypothetical protein